MSDPWKVYKDVKLTSGRYPLTFEDWKKSLEVSGTWAQQWQYSVPIVFEEACVMLVFSRDGLLNIGGRIDSIDFLDAQNQ